MAITKVGCMKASKKKQKDIHLKNSINYILNPMKLGMVNLAGGINCPLEIAYEQMKATKEMFQKTGGRQGYSLIISLKPGEGTPEIMYDIAMRFTDIFLKGKYEAVVAVHTDRAHLHAHIVFNSIDMTEGYKFQYHNGDWKHILQPITNQLCEEYGLEIMPAEYSEDPKNMSRPEWEREQSYSTLIKGDAFYCAILAESNQHFIFLLKSLGYDVKEGKHIAVKAPGMKRFKRIDTIDEQLSKENLDILIRYGDSKSARPKVNTFNPIYVKRAKLSQFQKKYYARMYRLRLIEKKRFNYKSAYYYESIKQMHLLQEEYLLVVNNDVNSFTDLLNLTNELQQDLKDVETEQNQMYSNHGIEKRKCKEVEDFEKFRSNEPEYKRELEALKERKGKIKDQIQIADRCYKKELSRAEEVLERMIPVGDMEDIGDIYDVDVPENPYKEAAVKVEEVIAPKQIAPVVEAVIEPMIEPKSMIIPESVIKPITEIVDVVENEAKINFEIEETLLYIPQNTAQEIRELPKTLDEYQRLSLQEKAERFPFEKYTDDKAFDYFMNYLTEIGSNMGFSEAYDEFAEISEFYDKMQEQKLVEHEIEKSMYLCDEMGMSSELFKQANADIRAMVFHLDELDYKVGIKVYRGVLEKLGIQKDLMEVYEEFDEVYKESVTDKKKDEKEWRR
ncbi:relaxase/mobilization nuclease domain-containing protein [Clostridium sp. C8]|uniref:relaxase/mobilization nuclease domain-containing protein n=3 Tax=unclassified Clostridium TaxID=2614128 RepID=UPI00069BF77B|nr:relaxase/mobilization nuclease domain-containing protein [Clostridium sp. C8]